MIIFYCLVANSYQKSFELQLIVLHFCRTLGNAWFYFLKRFNLLPKNYDILKKIASRLSFNLATVYLKITLRLLLCWKSIYQVAFF